MKQGDQIVPRLWQTFWQNEDGSHQVTQDESNKLSGSALNNVEACHSKSLSVLLHTGRHQPWITSGWLNGTLIYRMIIITSIFVHSNQIKIHAFNVLICDVFIFNKTKYWVAPTVSLSGDALWWGHIQMSLLLDELAQWWTCSLMNLLYDELFL